MTKKKSTNEDELKKNFDQEIPKTNEKPTINNSKKEDSEKIETKTKREQELNDREIFEVEIMNQLKILGNQRFYKKAPSQNEPAKTMEILFQEAMQRQKNETLEIIVDDQYKEALEMIVDADTAGLYPILVGPPGVGKTAICRYYSQIRSRYLGNACFEWLTFDEATKPAHLIGSYNPAVTINEGFTVHSYNFGPLTRAMLHGGIFLANEINRATEYTQNSLLEPLEERTVNIPHLGRISADPAFFFIGAMNPSEIAGTHRIADALKDRLKVWINLDYPSKNTEIRILKVNNPYFAIGDANLDLIYNLIHATRESSKIEIPASLRAGIGIARLIGIATQKGMKDIKESLAKIAFHVLIGSIKTKPGIEQESLIRSIIKEQLGIDV